LLSKTVTLDQALGHVKDGTSIMVGGFGGIGSPPSIIEGILQKGVNDLRLIGNDAGFPDVGIGRLIAEGRVKSLITTHIGSNPLAGKQMLEGRLDVTFYP
ncbi:branched-chain amino acid dehydrogenase, partial [Microbacteriaceae bacterium K1510]|nr:branched-chain amino acid dehydrogenase [Microbacteriaceae bacterium K1510]